MLRGARGIRTKGLQTCGLLVISQYYTSYFSIHFELQLKFVSAPSGTTRIFVQMSMLLYENIYFLLSLQEI